MPDLANFTQKQQRQLQHIKSQICLRVPLDVGINVIKVKGQDESGNPMSGAQIILQQVVDYGSNTVRRIGYLVTTTELDVVQHIDTIISKIVLEWNNPPEEPTEEPCQKETTDQ